MKHILSFAIVIAIALHLSGCRYDHGGESSATDYPVKDGRVVLVRQGMHRGAFVLKNQTMTPETTDYRWFSRSDGGGTFLTTDPSVSTGTVVDATKVEFSVFSVDWSINSNGKGWVYYSLLPSDTKSVAAFEMCVTKETDISKVDANDSRWVFRKQPKGTTGTIYKP